MRYFEIKSVLLEGGNVFKNEEGELTRRIDKADVPTTIKWLENNLKIDIPEQTWLGSTGKKETSGDLDLSVDLSVVDKDELFDRLVQLSKQLSDSDEVVNKGKFKAGWISKSGDNIHFRAPINGDPKNGFVQVDFMFTDSPDWQKWALRGEAAPYKGVDRHILLSSIAKAKGMKYSWKNGLDGVKDPDKVASMLFGPGKTVANINTIPDILATLETVPNKEELVANATDIIEKGRLSNAD